MSLNSKMTAIADEIRAKTGGTESLTLDQMANDLKAIANRTSSDLTVSGATITVPAGNYKSQATKSISNGSAKTPTTTITKNPTISVDTSGKITASVSGTQNVTPTVTAGYVSSGTAGTITVSGSATSQLTTQAAKTVTPTKSAQTAVSSGVYTTGAITVAAIPNEYITTNDATASSDEIMSGETAYVGGSKVTGTFTIDTELTAQDNLISQIQTALQNKASASEPVLQAKTVTPSTSSQTVKPDAGYAGLSQVTVDAITTATQATPSITVNTSGLITASATQTAGYVSEGTKSSTKQLTTQAAKTVTPSTSSQTAVASGVYTTGAVTVAAIPSTYVKPNTTKSATTYTPSTSNQTIAAGTYCSGVQTIKGDTNLVADNIKSGVSIFGVNGTYEGSGSGGGGSIETCHGYIMCDGPAFDDVTFYYINSNMELATASGQTFSFYPIKNSIIFVTNWTAMSNLSNNISLINYNMQRAAYYVSGDFTLIYST